MSIQCQFRILVIKCLLVVAFAICHNSIKASNQDTESGSGNKLFAVEIKVGPNWDMSKSPNEQPFFREHSANLKRLREAGHIVMGARYSDIGLIIFSALSVDEVREHMSQDPSMTAKTFRYEVYPMNVFYPGMVKR